MMSASLAAQTPQQPRRDVSAPEQPPRPSPRRRGAEGTREFLGLGPAPDAAAAGRGAKLYASTCSFCHGPAARGAEGPDLVRSTLVLHDEKGELIGPVIHNGRPDRGMPAFPAFTESQLNDIAQYLHMQIELAANRGTYKLLNIVSGDAKAGEAYFNGPGKCNTCHSVTGDLAHIGSKLEPADLQQTFLYPASRALETDVKQHEQQKVTVTVASGQVISGTLKYLDDFNVLLYDAAGNLQSVERKKNVKVQLEDKLLAHRRLLDQYTDADVHNLTAYLVTLK
jgi:mono/diheme cytochrome c family protein/small nuclear ribonucleoprotein (snRNP)-like protein